MRAQRVATQQKANPETLPEVSLACANPNCGVEFTPTRKWQRYHNSACRFRDWKRRTKKAAPAKNSSTAPRRYIVHCVVEVE